jgi:hypothetical protein
MRPFAYPPDAPQALWDAAREFEQLAAGYEDAQAGASQSAKVLDAAEWQGRAATAGLGALRRVARRAEDSAASLRAVARALESYAGIVTSARAQIDMLRAKHSQLAAEMPNLAVLVSKAVISPSPMSFDALRDGLATRARVGAGIDALNASYQAVAARVRRAAADAERVIAANLPAGAVWQGRKPDDPNGKGKVYPGGEEGGLGPGKKGTKKVMPDAPPWPDPDHPLNEGYDTKTGHWPDWFDVKLDAAARALKAAGPLRHAGTNLLHYLSEAGGPLEQDVDAMLRDLPSFRSGVKDHQKTLAEAAIAAAKNAGGKGPMTYPISTEWYGHYATPDESKDWYYATGGFEYSLQGSVTVRPPATPGGEWTAEVTTRTSTWDAYNWDEGKKTEVPGLGTVTDAEMRRLMLEGKAKEFEMYGKSEKSTVTVVVK